MDDPLNIGLFNTQPGQDETLRNAIAQVKDLNLVLETARWEELEGGLRDGALELVLVNLDSDAPESTKRSWLGGNAEGGSGTSGSPVEFGTKIVQHILRAVPDIGIIGVSTRTDPNTIISAMRAGCTQFVCAPIDVEDFRNAVERIKTTRMAVPHESWRLCVVGSSGGVGATLIGCNLAMELAGVTHRTSALVDLNLEFGDAAFSFDCEPKYTLADLCDTGSPIDRTMVESAVHQLPCNVALLSRPARVSDARLVTPDGMEQVLRNLAAMYPYVVVDLPRTVSPLNAVALRGANLIMIVAQLSIPSLRNASRVHDLLLEMGADGDKIEIVLNRCRAEHQRISPDDVEQHFQRPVFAMVPNDYRRVTAALDFGHPMMADAPNSPARMAIHELAQRIAGDGRTGHAPAAATATPKGLLKRWLGGAKATPKDRS